MKIKKLLTSLLLATIILMGGQAVLQAFSESDINTHTAYAAPTTCPEIAAQPSIKGAYDEKKATCTYTSTPAQTACPEGWIQDPPTKNNELTCIKAPDAQSAEVQEQLKKNIFALVSIQSFLNRLLWPVLVMIGGLMDNSLLFGSGMEARLREIWIPIRNIVNILFVVGLIGVALYNVLGIADENGTYSIKEILPKIIIGIIAVNFSFIGIKVFLDGITAFTNAVFALPGNVNEELASVMKATSKEDQEVIRRFCLGIEGKKASDITSSASMEAEIEQKIYQKAAKAIELSNMDGKTKAEIEAAAKAASPDKENKLQAEVTKLKTGQFCSSGSLTPTGEAFLSRWNSRNAALAMALNMTKIVFYEDVAPSVDNIDKLFVNTVFSVMLYLIYAASFVTLFIVLLARLVVLWVVVAMSPVLVLGLVLPVIKEKISGFGELVDKFVQNAIAPLGIAISMTVGWIMLRALQGVNQFDSQSIIALDPTNGIPVVGLNTLQDLIVAVGTVAIVWLGVFTAASKSIAAPVTDVMKSGLETAGKWLVKTPLRHVKIVPITTPDGKEEKFSIGDVAGGLMEKMTEHKPNKFYEYLGGSKYRISDLNDRQKINSGNDVLKLINTRHRIEDDTTIIKAIETMNNPEALANLQQQHQEAYDKINTIKTSTDEQDKTTTFNALMSYIQRKNIGKFPSDEKQSPALTPAAAPAAPAPATPATAPAAATAAPATAAAPPTAAAPTAAPAAAAPAATTP